MAPQASARTTTSAHGYRAAPGCVLSLAHPFIAPLTALLVDPQELLSGLTLCWAYREQRALAGRRGAGRPELDLLGYAPRSRRLAQLLGGVHGCSRSHCVCLCTALGMPSVLQAASQHTEQLLLREAAQAH